MYTVENLQLGRLNDCMQHYAILQANLVALANDLDNYPAEETDPYSTLNVFPDEIMRRDVLEDLLPVGTKALPKPPVVPACADCLSKKVSWHQFLFDFNTPSQFLSAGIVADRSIGVSRQPAPRGTQWTLLGHRKGRVLQLHTGAGSAVPGQRPGSTGEEAATLQSVEQDREVHPRCGHSHLWHQLSQADAVAARERRRTGGPLCRLLFLHCDD